MNISRKCIEFWNKLGESVGKYVKVLLITVGIVGAFFAGNRLDVDAVGDTDGDTDAMGRAKTIYFTSEGFSPWTNEFCSYNYSKPELKTNLGSIDAVVSVSDDFTKGAWKMMYDESKVEGDSFEVEFDSVANVHYEFSGAMVLPLSSGISLVGNPSLPEGNDNRKLNFKLKVDKTDSDSETVEIGGQKYTDYSNKFSYEDENLALMDMVTVYRHTAVSDFELSTDGSIGGFKEIWTVGDVGYDFGIDKLDATYLVSPKEGYGINSNVGVKVNGTPLTRVESESEQGFYVGVTDIYPRGFALINDFYEATNNSIVIDNIRKRYDVKLISGLASVEDYVEIINPRSDWGESIIADLPLDGQFTVDLRLNDDRRYFKSAGDIKNEIRRVNSDQSDIDELVCTRNGDTSITLTIPHSVSQRELKIPPEVFNWKTANVDFLIDFSFADDIYREETLQSIKLYKGLPPALGESIPLREDINSFVVNVDRQEDVGYDNLIYTLNLSDDTYVDLSEAAVVLQGGNEDEEIRIIDRNKNTLTFMIDTSVSAPYRRNLKFRIHKIRSNLKAVTIDLCAKAILYLKNEDETLRHLATAPSDSRRISTIFVPEGGNAKYVILYPDYSRIFGIERVIGNCATGKELIGFNKVIFSVDTTSSDLNILCDDPSEPAPPIKFTPIEGAKYYEVDDNKLKTDIPIEGVMSIPYGEDFSFAVECKEGYDDATLEIKANDNPFSESGDGGFKIDKRGSYCVLTVSKDAAKYPITITGSVRMSQRRISFEKRLGGDCGDCDYIYNGASVTHDIDVIYGQGISFEVTLPDKCNQSDIVVKFNDIEVPRINGKYVLNNITSDGTITVSGASINKYPVTFASNARATYKNTDGSELWGNVEVSHGGSYEFRVQPNSGYKMGEDSAVCVKYADGTAETLKSTNDVYKIGGMPGGLIQGCLVSVENVEDIVYTIKLIPTDGVTYLNDVDNVIKDIARIKHGRNFEFSVSLSDEYDDSLGGMNIIVNDGKSSQSSVQKLASGRYVIPNVSEDITIKVGNVRKNSYTVTLTGAEGIDYYNSSGKVITGDNQAEHHSDFSFKVELYPAYKGSDILVMLGDTPMEPDENGFYTISKISESKTVTVAGITMNGTSELVNNINGLPDRLNDLGDVDDVIEASKAYEALSDEDKALIGNVDKLKSLQEQAKGFHHVSNDVRISGVDWYIKLYAIPITDDTDACGRIYKKLTSEYILSLYNVYLWDTLNDTRYTLPEGQNAVITLPTPNLLYFEKPTAIHEKEAGKIKFINASINNETTTFQTDSFSPMGIVANRSSTPGRSSLLDATDANLDAISNFAASLFGNETNKVTRSNSSDSGYNDLSGDSGEDDDTSGNIDEKFRSRNNRVTTISSALRLILVLMILVLIGLMIYFFIKRRKDKEDMEKE